MAIAVVGAGSNSLAAGSLGRRTKYSSTCLNTEVAAGEHKAVLLRRYALQAEARRLLPSERVAQCGRWIIPGKHHVELRYSPERQRSSITGCAVCGSLWSCPVCSAKISERRRVELACALDAARSAGLRVVMLTLTLRHHRGDDLRSLLDVLSRSWGVLTAGRAGMELRRTHGMLGYVRSLEVTYSLEHGWHPHLHVLLFLDKLPDGASWSLGDLDAFLRGRWERVTASLGHAVNEHGLTLTSDNEHLSEYVAKYGHDRRWDLDSELTRWHSKHGRADSLTPWDLLEGSFAGDTMAGALFVAYVEAMRGRHQLEWGKRTRALLLDDLDEQTDEQLATAAGEDMALLAYLSRQAWRVVYGNGAVGDLLALVEDSRGDLDAVDGFLAALGAGLCIRLGQAVGVASE